MASNAVTLAFKDLVGFVIAINDQVVVFRAVPLIGDVFPRLFIVPLSSLPCAAPRQAATCSISLKGLTKFDGFRETASVFEDNGCGVFILFKKPAIPQDSIILHIKSSNVQFLNDSQEVRYRLHSNYTDGPWLTCNRVLQMIATPRGSEHVKLYKLQLPDIPEVSIEEVTMDRRERLFYMHALSILNPSKARLDVVNGKAVLLPPKSPIDGKSTFLISNASHRAYFAKFEKENEEGSAFYCKLSVRDLLTGRQLEFVWEYDDQHDAAKPIGLFLSPSEERILVERPISDSRLVDLKAMRTGSLEERAAEVCWNLLAPHLQLKIMRKAVEERSNGVSSAIDFIHFCYEGK